jgi:hypothetical protein
MAELDDHPRTPEFAAAHSGLSRLSHFAIIDRPGKQCFPERFGVEPEVRHGLDAANDFLVHDTANHSQSFQNDARSDKSV